ncbi:hypothetical protein NLI96_g6429 [Meripilus lineatus]|uniref:Uncharacterized protein n=1 Tax=Meripilus lineatus TaxID=2056292 RepID=A0AAD5V3D5_9APHY|nr:hypothetical protein NLI96_g6429 [Physisporinus lineatus]
MGAPLDNDSHQDASGNGIGLDQQTETPLSVGILNAQPKDETRCVNPAHVARIILGLINKLNPRLASGAVLGGDPGIIEEQRNE